jgi:O-antigen/teichoic acid export membrane protein
MRRGTQLFRALRPSPLSPVAWVTVEKVTQQVLWLIIFAVLAPILGPRPYGLFSIVMVFVGLCEMILLEGAIEALVTVDDLDHLHTSTTNLTTGVIAAALGLAVAALAPAIGTLYRDDELTRLIWVLTPLPLLSSLSATPIAVLRRSLSYRLLAIRSIIALLLGGSLGIALALAGYGVWALAVQVLAQRFAEFVIAWLSAPVRMGFKWSGAHFRELSPIGFNVFSGRIMSFAGGQLPRVILGYMLGPEQLGLFTLATRFYEIIIQTAVQPLTAVGRVELRHVKPGSAEFGDIFAKLTQNVALLSFPIFVGAAAVTPDLFRIWLDQRWAAGVVPMQFMLLGGIPFVFYYCIDAAFLAANLSRLFAWATMMQAVTIVLTVLCTGPFGLDPTCLGLAIRPWLLLPLVLLWLHRACRLPILQILSVPMRSLAGAALMGALLLLPWMRPAWLLQIPTFILLVGVGAILYFAFLYLFLWSQLKTLKNTIFMQRP